MHCSLVVRFQIGFHHPNTVIDYSSPGKSIYMLRLNTLSLKVSEVSTSERVQSLSVQQRNCKLPSDAGLSTWPVYSSVLCQLECRHGTVRNLCGCLPHFAKPMEGKLFSACSLSSFCFLCLFCFARSIFRLSCVSIFKVSFGSFPPVVLEE